MLKEQVKLANFLQKRFRSHANGTVSDRPAPGGADLANLVLMRKFVIRMMKVRENISLLGMNSFGFDVSARRLVEFASAEDLRQAFASMPSGEPWYVLGGGNNVLFTADYGGTLLHPLDRSVTLEGGDGERALVRVGAGAEWDDFVGWAVGQGLGGIENLSLIPGCAGAAPVQNIGAYGVEAKDTIESVECYLPDEDRVVALSNAECRFGYRDSVFKRELRSRAVILSVLFGLSRRSEFRLRYEDVSRRVDELGGPSLKNIREAVVAIRRAKLPDPKVLGNAGSFFKNPVVSEEQAARLLARWPDMPRYGAGEGFVKLAAGWLIDRCGWKGRRMGPVGVHDRQALVLVHYGGGTGADVMRLARAVQRDVAERFGVRIDMEVNLL